MHGASVVWPTTKNHQQQQPAKHPTECWTAVICVFPWHCTRCFGSLVCLWHARYSQPNGGKNASTNGMDISRLISKIGQRHSPASAALKYDGLYKSRIHRLSIQLELQRCTFPIKWREESKLWSKFDRQPNRIESIHGMSLWSVFCAQNQSDRKTALIMKSNLTKVNHIKLGKSIKKSIKLRNVIWATAARPYSRPLKTLHQVLRKVDGKH